jgi:heme-degrading monooxygenase HmoA
MSRWILPGSVVIEEEAMLRRMIVVHVPAEKAAEAERLWKQGCAPLMIQQPGCISEEFLRNAKDPGEIISLQSWENQAAIDRYRKSPAHEEVLRHTRGLMGVSKVEVRTYEVIG